MMNIMFGAAGVASHYSSTKMMRIFAAPASRQCSYLNIFWTAMARSSGVKEGVGWAARLRADTAVTVDTFLAAAEKRLCTNTQK
jgi:hypothetical protein